MRLILGKSKEARRYFLCGLCFSMLIYVPARNEGLFVGLEGGLEMTSTFDVVITALYIVGMFGLGVYFATKINNTQEYFLGSRSWGWMLIAFTIIATNLGAGYTVGASGKAVSEGVSAVWFLTAQSLSFIVLAYIMVPRIYPLKALTIAEFFEDRYSKGLRWVAGITLCAGTFALLPAQVVAGTRIVQMLTGFEYESCFVFIGLIIIVYTAMGGLPSVVYTDFLQTLLIALGFVVAVPILLNNAGGFHSLYDSLPANMKDWFYGATGTWTPQNILAWVGATLMGRFGAQVWYQRSQAASSLKEAQKGYIWGGILGVPFGFLTMVVGVYAVVKFPGIKPNAALPHVFMNELPAGVRAVALGAIIAAIMSSGDSFLNAASALFINDIYKPLIKNKSELHYVRVAQLSGIGFGLISMYLAYGSAEVLEWIELGFLIRTSASVVVMLGLFWKRANGYGAYASLLLGTFTTFYWTKVLHSRIDAFWPTAAVSIGAMVVVSLMTAPPAKEKIEFFDIYNK